MRVVFFVIFLAASGWSQTFDLAITGGRVIDPDSGLDAIRNIGISHGKIAAIRSEAVAAKDTINASGLVVAPGFIDLHSHGQDAENYRYKARDGVTTALELEVGVHPVKPWYAAREGKALVNFGASSGHIPARMLAMHDSGTFLPRDHAVLDTATEAQREEVLQRIAQGLEDGALGVGLGIAYMPKTSREEILDVFRCAGKAKMACFVHMRYPGPVEPGVVDALQEVLADAEITGAGLHVVHLPSMALRQTALCLDMIKKAHANGVDVSTEAYPYTAGMTRLETAIFDTDWQARLGIGFGDLQWVRTGERLTAESFSRYREEGGEVILHSIPEEVVRATVADPSVMIASDGWITNGKGHPRGAGTYARVLGRYVREEHALSLTAAIRQMSLMPAQRLEAFCPAMRVKGRIRMGADADLAIFDAATVTDRATYENPAQFSSGIPFVIVHGVPVVRNGEIVEGVFPGRGVKTK